MRALLIDDERRARAEMRRLLGAHPEVTIAGEAANVSEAKEMITRERPDLLFLDVEMPGATGFDLLDEIASREQTPAVIFTTAFDRYALRAFEVRAADYLLKPVTPERLKAALEHVRTEDRSEPQKLPLDQFFIREGERAWMVRAVEIKLIEAEGNYARLHFGENRPLILRSLQTLQARLDEHFFRANRSQIVNLRWIARMELEVDGAVRAVLKDGTEVIFSRRQSQALKERMAI
ncbi:response regulator transcription factor [Terriglobus albidus]|uniref:Response regulator transcription factor n=1 Tax=Terriglobus albidus TaxID=1592106 RepID=A0A5B9E2T0_9BACT|nr:LytTR family DNA-binding domain-containing protein [Terriglobus albidus]QEE26613.1 response regulator transcription factor [Terriglobus albidus]